MICPSPKCTIRVEEDLCPIPLGPLGPSPHASGRQGGVRSSPSTYQRAKSALHGISISSVTPSLDTIRHAGACVAASHAVRRDITCCDKLDLVRGLPQACERFYVFSVLVDEQIRSYAQITLVSHLDYTRLVKMPKG